MERNFRGFSFTFGISLTFQKSKSEIPNVKEKPDTKPEKKEEENQENVRLRKRLAETSDEIAHLKKKIMESVNILQKALDIIEVDRED